MSELPVIDRYVVERELGSGAFGAVYRGRHVVLGRPVALKVLHRERATNASVMERFLREARAVAQLGSPNVVQVLDADQTRDGNAFIAMELLDGEDLAARLARGRLPTYRAIRIAREICAGLSVAHAQGIVHRDLKPANVFLAKDAQGSEVAKILDFGISKVRVESPADELTRTGTMLGTPQYMAPEQFRGSKSVDARADLHALGSVLYEMLSGRMACEARTLEQLIAQKLDAPPRPLHELAPDVPRAVTEIVDKALALDPDARWQSAAELDAALARVEGVSGAPGVSMGTPSGTSFRPPAPSLGASTLSAPAPASRPSRVVPVLAGFAGLVVIGLFAALALTLVGVWLARNEIDAWLGGDPPATSGSPPTVAAPVPALPPRSPTAPIATSPPATVAPPPAIEPAGPAAVPATVTEGGGVSITASTLGAADSDLVAEIATRARPALAACRGPARFDETLQFTLTPLGVAQPSGLDLTPSPTRSCVRSAIAAVRFAPGVGSGIVRYQVVLEPL
ncbi:MAG: protein kinase [Sandaracinus sp.]